MDVPNKRFVERMQQAPTSSTIEGIRQHVASYVRARCQSPMSLDEILTAVEDGVRDAGGFAMEKRLRELRHPKPQW